MRKVLVFFFVVLSALFFASCEGKGKVVIKEPPNADVYVNGKHVGKTPIVLELKEAKYDFVVATTPWDLDVKKGVQVYFDKTIELKFKPTPRGLLVADTKPEGALVLEGKNPIGKTPLKEKIPVGDHELIFKLGDVGTTRIVNIQYGKTTKIFVNLEKAVVHFFANPEDGKLIIDGKEIGSFPKTVELSQGVHEITVEKGIFKDSFDLKVKKGDEIKVTYILEPVQLPPVQAYGPLSFTPDNKYLVSMGKAGIYFWDIKKFKPQISLYDPKDVRNFDKFINYGIAQNGAYVAGIKPIRKLAYALKDKTKKYDKILVWDMKTTFPVLSKLYPMESMAVSFNKDASKLYFITKDGKIKIADRNSGNIKGEKDLGHKPTYARYKNGKVYIATEDGFILVFDTETDSVSQSKKVHNGKIYTVEISKDGKDIITASSDKTVKILDTSLNTVKTVAFNKETLSANVSPSKEKLAVGFGDNSVKVIDVKTGKELYSIKNLRAPAKFLVFSNEEILITASDINTPVVDIWKNGHLLKKWIQTIQ
ncbi:MAG: PEGA domain-containing protein [Aquificota bacterium]|nr:MAG: PEGA domain-containing protein [Aquificota bacterium]